MKKPIDSATHGVIDYVFGAAQLTGPSLLNLDKKVVKTYQLLGTAFTVINLITDTPVGINLISMKTHQKADTCFLAGLSALTVSKMIAKDKKTLAFHLGFLGLAIVNYVLTDYRSEQ